MDRKFLYKKELPNSNEVYFSGDVVEILNLTEHQIHSMMCVMSKMANEPSKLIGFRYKLKCSLMFWTFKNPTIYYKLVGFTFDHNGSFEDSQFRLVYRPAKNWIKLIRLKIFGRYYP